MRKNLLIGAAGGFGVEQLQNFVRSFREFNTFDDIVLITNPEISEDLKTFFEEYSVTSVAFKNYQFFDTLVHNARYIEYLDFLQLNEYKNVFLADTRDIVFQADPFKSFPDEFLYLFLEDPNNSIGSCEINSYWIEAAYGKEVKDSLSPNTVICSGTILGSYNEIIKFLNKYREELVKVKSNYLSSYSSIILDQAIVNYIGRTYQDSFKITFKNNGDLVATLGVPLCSNKASDQIIFDNGKIAINNYLPAVVHQYDRNEMLAKFYNFKYAGEVNLTKSTIK